MKVLVIEPNQPPEVRDVDATSDALRQIVGGYLEAVSFVHGAIVYLDEEAKIRTDKTPVFNPFATALVNTFGLGLLPGDFITNPAVIVGTLDDQGEYDGDEHDVPQPIVDVVMSYYRKYAGISDQPGESP